LVVGFVAFPRSVLVFVGCRALKSNTESNFFGQELAAAVAGTRDWWRLAADFVNSL
jgi:hypothetical protein